MILVIVNQKKFDRIVTKTVHTTTPKSCAGERISGKGDWGECLGEGRNGVGVWCP